MPDPSQPVGPPLSSMRRVFRSFRFAAAGVVLLLRTQPNARVHLVAASLAITMGILLRLPATAWAVLVTNVALVLTLESINTALEFVVDLASPGYHELAKAAKDTAAAAVLIAAVLSLVVGVLLFGPRLWEQLHG